METRVFVRLRNLLDITYEGDTAEELARWKANVLNSVGSEGYTMDDGVGDDWVTEEFSTDEIEFATADCYNFMGSAYEQERFYGADWIVVREKATGDLYAYLTDEMAEGAF